MNYVLDASVIIKWFRLEIDREKALSFQKMFLNREINLFEPDLLFYELGNVLKTKSNVSEQSVKKFLELIFKYNFSVIHPSYKLFSLANKLAFHYKTSIYDAVYLACAKELSCDFITADKKLFLKVKSLGRIKLLENIEI